MNFEVAKNEKGEVITECNHCEQISSGNHGETCFSCDIGEFWAVFVEELEKNGE